nr:MAG TPA: hypothetical protein [Caudoviricetes sp.]
MVKIFSIVSSLIFLHFGYFLAEILIKLDLTKKVTIRLDAKNVTTITPMYFFVVAWFAIIWGVLLLAFFLSGKST